MNELRKVFHRLKVSIELYRSLGGLLEVLKVLKGHDGLKGLMGTLTKVLWKLHG